MAAAAPDDNAYLSSLVREADRPRYFSTLIAPEPARSDLLALYGFAAEIARIPDQVRDATLGEIRLQWWHDSLESALREPGQGGAPALRALVEAMKARALPVAPVLALIDARRTDLYSDPPATRADLEGHFGETQSALFQLAALVLGGAGPDSADAAGHAGIAYGLARRLAGFAADRARGRSIVPADLLAGTDLAPGDVFRPDRDEALVRLVAELAGWVHEHLRQAEAALASVPPALRPAFLPLAIVPPLLGRIERLGPRILVQPAVLSDLESLTRITGRALRDRTGLRWGLGRRRTGA